MRQCGGGGGGRTLFSFLSLDPELSQVGNGRLPPHRALISWTHPGWRTHGAWGARPQLKHFALFSSYPPCSRSVIMDASRAIKYDEYLAWFFDGPREPKTQYDLYADFCNPRIRPKLTIVSAQTAPGETSWVEQLGRRVRRLFDQIFLVVPHTPHGEEHLRRVWGAHNVIRCSSMHGVALAGPQDLVVIYDGADREDWSACYAMISNTDGPTVVITAQKPLRIPVDLRHLADCNVAVYFNQSADLIRDLVAYPIQPFPEMIEDDSEARATRRAGAIAHQLFGLPVSINSVPRLPSFSAPCINCTP
jgi:hypothetical protein